MPSFYRLTRLTFFFTVNVIWKHCFFDCRMPRIIPDHWVVWRIPEPLDSSYPSVITEILKSDFINANKNLQVVRIGKSAFVSCLGLQEILWNNITALLRATEPSQHDKNNFKDASLGRPFGPPSRRFRKLICLVTLFDRKLQVFKN